MSDINRWLLVVYLSDMGSLLALIMIVGDFPNTNYFYVDIINNCILWALFKTLVYGGIVFSYKYINRYSNKVENIMMILCIVFALFTFYNLHEIQYISHSGSIDPNFYRSFSSFNTSFVKP